MSGFKPRRFLFAACLIALASPARSHAQQRTDLGMPVLHNYSSKDTNVPSQVWDMIQDRRGVLFFGGSNAATEYDGVTWRRLPVPASVVRSFAMDSTGKIWVGANATFGYLEPDANGTLHYVSLLEKIPPEHRAFNDVWHVLITPQGKFFQAYERLFRWDGKTMHVWTTDTRFQALAEVRGHIYTSQGGIGLQEIVGDDLREVPGGAAYKDSTKLFLYPYDDGRMLVSARGEALTLYDGQKVTPFPTQADDYLKKNELYTYIPLPDGSFCLNTLRGGAVILEHDGRLRRILGTDTGLQNPSVLSSYSDREGGLWLGLSAGVTRVEINSPISIFSRDSLLDIASYKGSHYAATGAGGTPLYRLTANSKTGLPSLQPIPSSASQAFNLLSIHDPSGKIPDQLLAATGKGIMKIEGDAVSPAVAGLQGLTQGASVLLQSRKFPNRVFAGHFAGLSSIRWEGGKWIDEGRLPKFSGGINALAEEADGTLWAATTDRKLLRIKVASTGMRESTGEFLTQKDGLVDGDMFVAFAGGNILVVPEPPKNFLRWDAAARRLVPDNRFFLRVKDPDAQAFLIPLDNGDVWSETGSSDDVRQGLFRRKPDGTYALDEEPFLRLSRFNINEFRSEPDGYWMAGADGIIRFDPRVKPSGQQSFDTLVRRVSSGPKDIVFGGAPLAAASAMKLPHDRNSLQFEFAAPTYDDEAANPISILPARRRQGLVRLGQTKGSQLRQPRPRFLSIPRPRAQPRRPHRRRRRLQL